MTTLPEYEIHAIKYARRDAWRRDHFIGGDPHELPMAMDYFVWVITGPAGAIVMDLGFTAEMAKQRKREFLRCPIESLKLVGVDARDVNDVIVSHMHYDHAGNLDKFPKARFHIQAREMAYATGKYMRHSKPGHVNAERRSKTARLNFKGRVEMHEGMVEIAPGITLHPAPGHADGLRQVARAHQEGLGGASRMPRTTTRTT
ncbi:MAG: N-acyl homoserine lactonase family protein [Hyphomicrobiaceae bacterium]